MVDELPEEGSLGTRLPSCPTILNDFLPNIKKRVDINREVVWTIRLKSARKESGGHVCYSVDIVKSNNSNPRMEYLF